MLAHQQEGVFLFSLAAHFAIAAQCVIPKPGAMACAYEASLFCLLTPN
jgi:hypothetical protein